MKTLLLAFILAFAGTLSFAQHVTEPANTPKEWSKPYPPFRIAGNLYYVGTYDLACYLLVTPKGNILINTGLAASVEEIESNIEALGFNLADTRILLTTQAHYDHMGAMAVIKRLTGAKMMVDKKDAGVMADGGKSDYALGGDTSYEPVKADKLLQDRDVISLGGTRLTLLHHPGHTKGSCSFIFEVKDGAKTYKVLIANMPTIVTNEKFNEITTYPEIVKDYAYTLAAMKKLSFDLWLSSHASQFLLHEKHKPGDRYNPSAFTDQKGYNAILASLEEQYRKKIAEK
ncbi:subclass B3 metallo-beta-lactamase [Hufsiella ginkgonis]|uniref:subclass B3 metallo-beta-lactamase n=1 Tax=Hufsiella ginkgonis TaxID=2695274 RepID=UPI003F71AE51